MALPSSGTISINSIRVELGVPSATSLSMIDLATGAVVAINPWSASRPSTSAPYLMSAWYNYNHSATAPSIASFYVYATTSPEYGGYYAVWSYGSGTSVNITDTYLDYSFNYGSSWGNLYYFSGTGTTSVSDSVEGLSGFTSLDNTYFRLRAYSNGTQVPSSPIVRYPPFPY
jgi:hypothetical protein